MPAADSIHTLYPPLDAKPVDLERLKKGMEVRTRYFYCNSIPGNKATVISVKRSGNDRAMVKCCYGHNLSGQPLIKWMDADALTFGD